MNLFQIQKHYLPIRQIFKDQTVKPESLCIKRIFYRRRTEAEV